jgi:hypothetical protein
MILQGFFIPLRSLDSIHFNFNLSLFMLIYFFLGNGSDEEDEENAQGGQRMQCAQQ